MNIDKVVDDIKDFMLEAGTFALKNQKNVGTSFKDGNQIVTETDLAISALIKDKLSYWLDKKNNILIDEESINLSPSQVFGNSEYQWVLDPIDGTAGYALGRNMWGISLAVLHNGLPLVGSIYMPAMGEIFIADENRSYKININNGTEEEIQTVKMDVNSQVFVESFFGGDIRWGKKDFSRDKIWLNIPESAVQGFTSMLTNKAAASTFITGYSIWDIAGAMALAKNTEYKILSMEDGSEWAQFSADKFKDNWKLDTNWLLTHPDNFNYISKALKGC
jgi:fructose-1,6-bisphosphatase/inositol monophosphatase family enzyme